MARTAKDDGITSGDDDCLPASLPPWTIKNPPIQWNDNTIPYLLTGSGLWTELLGGRFLAKNAKDPVMINISLATLVSLF